MYRNIQLFSAYIGIMENEQYKLLYRLRRINYGIIQESLNRGYSGSAFQISPLSSIRFLGRWVDIFDGKFANDW